MSKSDAASLARKQEPLLEAESIEKPFEIRQLRTVIRSIVRP